MGFPVFESSPSVCRQCDDDLGTLFNKKGYLTDFNRPAKSSGQTMVWDQSIRGQTLPPYTPLFPGCSEPE